MNSERIPKSLSSVIRSSLFYSGLSVLTIIVLLGLAYFWAFCSAHLYPLISARLLASASQTDRNVWFHLSDGHPVLGLADASMLCALVLYLYFIAISHFAKNVSKGLSLAAIGAALFIFIWFMIPAMRSATTTIYTESTVPYMLRFITEFIFVTCLTTVVMCFSAWAVFWP